MKSHSRWTKCKPFDPLIKWSIPMYERAVWSFGHLLKRPNDLIICSFAQMTKRMSFFWSFAHQTKWMSSIWFGEQTKWMASIWSADLVIWLFDQMIKQSNRDLLIGSFAVWSFAHQTKWGPNRDLIFDSKTKWHQTTTFGILCLVCSPNQMSKRRFFWLVFWWFGHLIKRPNHQKDKSKEVPFAHLVWLSNQTTPKSK